MQKNLKSNKILTCENAHPAEPFVSIRQFEHQSEGKSVADDGKPSEPVTDQPEPFGLVCPEVDLAKTPKGIIDQWDVDVPDAQGRG